MTSRADRVRELRTQLLAAGVTAAGADGRPRALAPVALGAVESDALRVWVQRAGARATLEIGLGYGIATLAIVEALLGDGDGDRSVRHVAIDPFQVTPGGLFDGSGLAHLEQAGVRDVVELHAEESQLVLPRFVAEGRRFDFAFVDGSHRFERVFLDLVYAGRLLDDRSVVFVDDVQLPAIRKAVGFCTANLRWTVEDRGREGDTHEWIVLRTSTRDVFDRPFTEFVDF
jgi:predicted O-methyltransferase YrrM